MASECKDSHNGLFFKRQGEATTIKQVKAAKVLRWFRSRKVVMYGHTVCINTVPVCLCKRSFFATSHEI